MTITKGETYKELSASDITKDALLILQARNCKAWRQVNTSVRGRKGIVKKGVSDILFFNRSTGLMGACEVKKIGDTLSDEQIEFLSELHVAGGIAMVATQRKEKTELEFFVDYYTKYTPNPLSGDGLKY